MQTVAVDLILNLSLLVAISIISGFIEKKLPRQPRLKVTLQGMLFGITAVLGMLTPLHLGAGVIIDGRSVMISLCAWFFGPWAASVAVLLVVSCRLWLGGVGVFTGILVILASAGIGLAAHSRLKPTRQPPSTLQLYLFGIVVHLAMLALLLTLPGGRGLTAVAHLGLPILLLFPAATILAGKILSDQATAFQVLQDLEKAKQSLAITLQSIGDAVLATNLEGGIVFMNSMAEKLTGWSFQDAASRPRQEVFRIINEETRAPAEDPVATALSKGTVVGLANHTLLIARDGTEIPIADSAAPIRDTNGEVSGVVLVFRDQREERREQLLKQLRLDLLVAAPQLSTDRLLARALDESSALVDSPIAFYHFVEPDQKTLKLQQWSTRTTEEFCQATGRGMQYGEEQAGRWADCLRQREAVVHNDFASLPDKKGFPEGHAPVIRELTVPVLRGDKVVAIMGVGNKPVPYTQQDVTTISYLADVIWHVVETKLSEEQLQDSEELFRSLFEDHAAVKLIIDPSSGAIVNANQAAAEFYGWSRDELRRMRIQDINLLSAEEVQRSIEQARVEKRVYFEFRHRRADGSVRDVAVFSNRIDVNGTELLHSIVQDNTERKRAERELIEALNFTEMLLAQSPMGIAVFDGTTGLCLRANQAAEQILVETEERLMGQDFREWTSWRSAGLLQIAETVLQNGIANQTKADLTRFGRPVGVRYLFSRFLAAEKPYLMVLCQDVSEELRLAEEKKRIEEKMLHTQKLESLGVLAGGIAHDFNNILMSVMGNTDLALRKLPMESPAFGHLKQIQNAADQAANLAGQMLAYSGKGKFVVEHLNINKLIEEMLHMLEVSISKKAHLRLELTPHLPEVEADATQLRQVIMNLVINASEAIGEMSGVIAITSGVQICDKDYLQSVWLEEDVKEGVYVYFEVADTGCGMDRETVNRIFDPFFSTKFAGRGLGMAAVLGIVRGHNGAIKVYSEAGRGTTFKILLPGMSKPAELFDITPPDIDWRGSGHVLLVDDEVSVRAIGRTLLEELGFKVLTASDGREALQVYKENPEKIRLVVMDLTMPHMGGDEAYRELRKLDSNIKVIITSGYNEQEVAHRFVGKGLAGFLQKPFRLSSLQRILQELGCAEG